MQKWVSEIIKSDKLEKKNKIVRFIQELKKKEVAQTELQVDQQWNRHDKDCGTSRGRGEAHLPPTFQLATCSPCLISLCMFTGACLAHNSYSVRLWPKIKSHS